MMNNKILRLKQKPIKQAKSNLWVNSDDVTLGFMNLEKKLSLLHLDTLQKVSLNRSIKELEIDLTKKMEVKE